MRLAATLVKVSVCPPPTQAVGELLKEKNVAALTDGIKHRAPRQYKTAKEYSFYQKPKTAYHLVHIEGQFLLNFF